MMQILLGCFFDTKRNCVVENPLVEIQLRAKPNHRRGIMLAKNAITIRVDQKNSLVQKLSCEINFPTCSFRAQ